MTLRIRTFGGVAVERSGKQVSGFASSKAQALLVYLACTGRKYPRETLAELLWDDRTQRRAMANLRVVLSSLRKTVGPYVSITRSEAGIKLDADLWLDVAQLEDAVALQAEEGLSSTRDAQSLAGTLALYAGDFLAGFFLPEASGFESWATKERERLHRAALDALQRLARWHLQEGGYLEAIRWATRTVEVDPLSEIGHRQLMEALARNGQRAQALAQYETCRQLLDEELGLELQEGTRALFEAIRAGTFVAGHSSLPAAMSRTVPNNLPTQQTPFFGRQHELAQLDALFAAPDAGLITITGVGGIGKTRLAYAAAEAQLARKERLFDDGVYVVSLSSVDDFEQLPAAIASAIGFSLEGAARHNRSGWQQVADYLQNKRLLLVLDNFEHLLPLGGQLSQLLQSTTALQLLVTSRERLSLIEEQVLPLEGIANGGWQDLEAARRDPLGQLFLHSARRVRPDFNFAPADLPHLARLRDMTAGLPLALVLAASWAEVLPLSEIVAEIGRDVDFLQSDLRNIPRRQHSMRAVFEASLRRLNPALQRAFCGLACFRGGFTREAAWEVAGASLRNLVALSSKSLLQYDAEQDRYQIHELLRQFGEKKLLDAPGVAGETRQRHAAFYFRLLHNLEQLWSGQEGGGVLARLEPEMGNVRRAWRWAAARDDVSLLADGLHGLCTYYDRRGFEDQAQDLLRSARERLLSYSSKGADDNECRKLLVRLLAWLSRFSDSLEERAAALDQADALLEALKREKIDVRREEAFLAHWRGNLVWDMGNVESSRAYMQRALAIYQELNHPAGTARAYGVLGMMEWHIGNYEEAASWGRRALEQQRALGDRNGLADVLGLLGTVQKYRGLFVEAQDLHRERYALYRELGHLSGLTDAAGTLAFTLGWSGEFAEAHTFVREGLSLAENVRSLHLTSFIAQAGAWICAHLGCYDEARRHAGRAVALAQTLDTGSALGWSLCYAGMLSLVAGDGEDAVIKLEEATAHLSEVQKSIWMVPLTHLAIAYHKRRHAPQARRALFEAISDSLNRREFFGALHALPPVSLCLGDQGHVQEAVEIYALACRYAYVANSRWYADIMGRAVARWEKALSREEVAKARKRGRARDLWHTVEELLEELGGDLTECDRNQEDKHVP